MATGKLSAILKWVGSKIYDLAERFERPEPENPVPVGRVTLLKVYGVTEDPFLFDTGAEVERFEPDEPDYVTRAVEAAKVLATRIEPGAEARITDSKGKVCFRIPAGFPS